MDEMLRKAIHEQAAKEPFARALGLELRVVEQGYSRVEMIYRPETMDNIYARAHGGAIFGLIDEAFETAGQTDGLMAVALNVNVTYVSSPLPGARLSAEARRISQTEKIAGYNIKVTDEEGRLIATCQALAYRTGRSLPFL